MVFILRSRKAIYDNSVYLKYMYNNTTYECICCGSILSLVQILFSFVFGYGNVW